MRVPFEWLKEFLPLGASPEEVARKLTMVGLEVEALERTGEDVIFEVNVTPNRADCLSIVGIARELAAAYGLKLTLPEHDIVAETGELDFNVDILDTSLCRRYAGRIVKNLTVGPSPEWMKSRLEKCGIRSINNVVDVTNYVLLELGHPLHAFDLETIRDHCIRVGTPAMIRGEGAQVTFTTLEGKERAIPGEALLIWDAEEPVAIAGIMGGRETEVSETTRNIFIESAYFDPVSVRKTSRALGLKTESSYRFERGTDIRMLKKALDRAAFLMKKIAGGTIYGKIDIYPKKYTPAGIRMQYERVERVLGLGMSREEISRSLAALGFTLEESGDSAIVTPPAYRTDVTRDADIMEELARSYGYDRIPAVLPKATLGEEDRESFRKSAGERIGNTLKESFLKSGFTEVINYSFMGVQDLEILGIPADDRRTRAVQIQNPLKVEDSLMRTALLPSLLRNVVHNVAHDNREFRLFETAKVFLDGHPSCRGGTGNGRSGALLPEERKHLAAVSYRERTRSLYREDTPDFFVVKGVFEAVLGDLKIANCTFVRSSEPFLHPGQSADILIGGTKIGYIGSLSPVVVERLAIKAQKPSIVVIEFDTEALLPFAVQDVRYKPLPKYPSIERDTALIVDADLEASAVMQWLREYPSDLIEGTVLFDVYQGKNIPAGKKSLAFTVRYRAVDRTLREEEIDSLHSSLVEYMREKTKGEVRS
ncbi:MAG: phenylalanine--tRNA ligase subunit beta [Alphaproteobacteria bacterium]|uniref:Phenylalanine--tRNA ligase beta subunit n=1 Tax=Candidatus Nitrobium versatile TaxID=2884831 RepID=A0A953JAY7_9BACT|nr:phenylalanine--tRNA ligase subunit beta [Candidatus Nitrobium versatile]